MSNTESPKETPNALHALQLEVDILRAQIKDGQEELNCAAMISRDGFQKFSAYETRIRELQQENTALQDRIIQLEKELSDTNQESLVYLRSSLSGAQRNVFLRNQLVTYQNEIDKLSGR
ncbi:MAG: hypothetical protein ABJN22_14535 [Litorimonas sp.]